nr:RNA-directed DNA polymerase, eukaryota [Tanacetum cinerariifolium]
MNHVGVASWFKSLHNVQAEFVAKEWIVWIDIEGVPLHAWSRATFAKIGSKWGEMMDLEDGSDDLFARKRICIKTNHASNILENFKIIVKRKVFWVRAKELFVWSLMFKEIPEVEHSSDDVSTKGEADNDNGTAGLNTNPPFPPGFTPEVRQQGSNTRIAKEVGNVEGNLYTDNRSCGFKLKEGGSILDILDEMIK